MSLSTQIAAYARMAPSQIFGGNNPLVILGETPNGGIKIVTWNVQGVSQPTTEQLAAWFSAPPSISDLAGPLLKAARASNDFVTAQVNSTETHIPAYVNMARWVQMADGPPTTDPYKTSFNNAAASFGTTPASFATMMEVFDVATPNMITMLNVLTAACATAKSQTDLVAALANFQASLDGEVASLNAALIAANVSVTIASPPAISIPGINA